MSKARNASSSCLPVMGLSVRRVAPPAYPCKLHVLGAPIGIQRKHPIGLTPTSSDSAPPLLSLPYRSTE